ncbi:MAG: sigma-70 family RNA polymerase sigma factor [Terracidiphilus sp.]|jgi:RNA polymerase sigma-70 factor (ECF subfamily)
MRPELIRATELLRLNTPEGVEEAIGLLQNTVYSFSMKVCGHPEDAEDTMQEVLFRSLGHLAKIENPQQLAVWLYTVTRNRCWRMRRKPAHAPARMLSLDELMPSDQEIGLLLQDGGISPELSLLDSEQHLLLHQATLRIPAPLRIVLVLHDMEELTTEQVAQILDLQQGTVRIRLHRARLTVRKVMKQLLNGAAGNSDRAESNAKRPSVRGSSRKKRPDECRDLFANLSEYMDGKLEPVPCEQMRTHIEACPSCVAFLRDLRAAIDRCRSLDLPCNSDLSPRLRAMLTREYLRMLVVSAAK